MVCVRVKVLGLGITGHWRARAGKGRAAFAFVSFHLECLFGCTGVGK